MTGAVLSVRLPADLVADLDDEATARGVNLSTIVREALERRNTLTGGSLAVTLDPRPAPDAVLSPVSWFDLCDECKERLR